MTQLVLGTSPALKPGVYTVNITGKTSLGSVVQEVRLDVLTSSSQFDDEVQRRGEYGLLGPEVISPYRGGDGFVYQSRVQRAPAVAARGADLLHVNTSELLDMSGVAAFQQRLPPTVGDDGSKGNWDLAVSDPPRLADRPGDQGALPRVAAGAYRSLGPERLDRLLRPAGLEADPARPVRRAAVPEGGAAPLDRRDAPRTPSGATRSPSSGSTRPC